MVVKAAILTDVKENGFLFKERRSRRTYTYQIGLSINIIEMGGGPLDLGS